MACMNTESFAKFISMIHEIVEVIDFSTVVVHATVGDVTWGWVEASAQWCVL